MAAFTRAKIARDAHERATEALATMPPLSTEDRQRLDEQIITRKTEIKALKKSLALSVSQLGLYDTLRLLRAKASAAKAEEATAAEVAAQAARAVEKQLQLR